MSRTLLAAVACFVFISCTQGGYVENPIARTIGWFSYAGGRDIREACDKGANAQYRFVYNAIYTEQVRTYDVMPSADGGAAVLVSRVIQPYPALRVTLSEPFGPWRGVVKRTSVGQAEVQILRDALLGSAFYQTAPTGLRLRSDNFYWVVSSCEDGEFHINAFQAPTERFGRITFPAVLFGMDSTGVAVNPVRRLSFGASEPTLSVDRSAAKEVGFVLQVGRDGVLR